MKRLALWCVVMGLGSSSAWAQKEGKAAKDDSQDERMDRQDRREERQQRLRGARREMELRRTVLIADELGLQETQALAIRDVLRAGDDKRMKLRQSIKAEVDELKRL